MKDAINKIQYLQGQSIGCCLFVRDDGHIMRGKERKRTAIFICTCGKEFKAVINEVKNGDTTSCGCGIIRNNKRAIPEIYLNGRIRPEYYSWCAMRRRCYDKNSPDYPNWGGRGITVCDRWNASFLNFLSDMGIKPTKGHTIDRVDNDGNYEPTNCRWATKLQQANNQRPKKRKIPIVKTGI